MPDPPDILESAENGSEGGRVLQGGFYGGSGNDIGIPTISHHFRCGGRCGGASLGVRDGGGHGRAGRAWKIG